MIPLSRRKIFYDALVRRDPSYLGVFYAAVRSTGVFCHSICPAPKPKFENCEFFRTAEEALLASYRPCKRCRPLSPPGSTTEAIQLLIDAVEDEPERRWRDDDFKRIGIDVSTARRQFKRRFGMTFVQYARARRMGIAMKDIRNGASVIDAQVAAGYESGSGFRDAFSRIMGMPPALNRGASLSAAWLDTPLGPMLAVVDDAHLVLLEFVNRRGLEKEIERLRSRTKSAIVPNRTALIDNVEDEINCYFAGRLRTFATPVKLDGTPFQKAVWRALLEIPFGQTCSYSELAFRIHKPNAVRAVAQANGANRIAIVVPCHRVVNADGRLGGYGGGVALKRWLLEHENSASSDCR